MCAIWIELLVLSAIGAAAMRGVAALLGVDATTTIGIGPARPSATPRRSIEVRRFPIWVASHVTERSHRPKVLVARASAPLAILLVPCALMVSLAMLAGSSEQAYSPFVVGTVVFDSPADEAGIEEGDIVVSFAGRPITDIDSLVAAEADHGGEPTEIVVERGGTRRTLEITPRMDRGRPIIGLLAGTRPRDVGAGEAARAIVPIVALEWGQFLSFSHPERAAPFQIVRRAQLSPDAPTALLLMSFALLTLAPLAALLSALGQIRSALARPRPTTNDVER